VEIQLQPEEDDIHKWRFAASGQYSAKSISSSREERIGTLA
jgi:hypothetical protein